MLKLDCRHLNSPLPLLLLKKKYGQHYPEFYEEIEIRLQADLEENQKDIEKYNRMGMNSAYKFIQTSEGIILKLNNKQNKGE